MPTPLVTLTAAQLRATAADDEQPVEPAPRRGRPRKHPPGVKPKPQRSGPQLKVQAPRATVERWKAAAKLAGDNPDLSGRKKSIKARAQDVEVWM